MGRRLPDYDPEVDGPYASSKRRMQIFKRIYQNLEHWRAQQEDHGLSDVITTVDGEDIYYGDLMIGKETLPRQQREAFVLICLKGYTESAATKIILPNSRWSTPVQQYSDDGLKKMIEAYDEKQLGTWNPNSVKKRRRSSMKGKSVVSKESEKIQKKKHRNWNFATWSQDHESLANYITAHGVDITPAQVKAVSFLRKQWYDSPEETTARQERKQARRVEREKFSKETPEQRKARHLAARQVRKAQLAQRKLIEIQEEIKKLRQAAGLDPDTGEVIE